MISDTTQLHVASLIWCLYKKIVEAIKLSLNDFDW